MAEKTEHPLCKQKRRDCNRNDGGVCVVLQDTSFNKPCPFYKKREAKEGKK